MLEVCVSGASPFTLDLYRMGFYGGAGARHMQHLGSRLGTKRDDPRSAIFSSGNATGR